MNEQGEKAGALLTAKLVLESCTRETLSLLSMMSTQEITIVVANADSYRGHLIERAKATHGEKLQYDSIKQSWFLAGGGNG